MTTNPVIDGCAEGSRVVGNTIGVVDGDVEGTEVMNTEFASTFHWSPNKVSNSLMEPSMSFAFVASTTRETSAYTPNIGSTIISIIKWNFVP